MVRRGGLQYLGKLIYSFLLSFHEFHQIVSATLHMSIKLLNSPPRVGRMPSRSCWAIEGDVTSIDVQICMLSCCGAASKSRREHPHLNSRIGETVWSGNVIPELGSTVWWHWILTTRPRFVLNDNCTQTLLDSQTESLFYIHFIHPR